MRRRSSGRSNSRMEFSTGGAVREMRYSQTASRRLPGEPVDRADSAGWRLFVVMQEAKDVVIGEAVAAAQEVEFDGEGQAGDFAAQLLDQL